LEASGVKEDWGAGLDQALEKEAVVGAGPESELSADDRVLVACNISPSGIIGVWSRHII